MYFSARLVKIDMIFLFDKTLMYLIGDMRNEINEICLLVNFFVSWDTSVEKRITLTQRFMSTTVLQIHKICGLLPIFMFSPSYTLSGVVPYSYTIIVN